MVDDPIARDPTVLAPGGTGATGDVAADRLAAGALAGDYVVDHHLGSGAMGVYAGHHPVIGKRVAIKVLKRTLADRSDATARFVREARAVNHVDHPGVVDVFAIGRLEDGRLFLVMDLLAGRSLGERLRAGPLAPALALRILGEIAAALDAAHGKGVIHRDLKPDNVVLTGPADAPTAHVLDFGIARLVADVAGERAAATLTGEGTWLGTPAYMAPEQWSADGATAASDRYALGIIAYQLLCGRVPFAAPSLPAMMEQHFRAAVPSVTAAGGAAPTTRVAGAAIDRVLARALAKEPAERYPSAAALVADLAAAIGAGPARVRAGRGGWFAGAAAGAVMIAGVVVVLGGRGRAARPRVDGARPGGGAVIEIATVPSAARVIEDGQDRGATPLVLSAIAGHAVALELLRPGYVPARRTVTARAGEPVQVHVGLALVTGFEGVWALPDDGGLRAFERHGEQVAGFSLAAPTAARAFLRFFEFVPSEAGVVFTATEPFVDERAPDEPSCNIPLRAEYRYEPDLDRLELRRERAQYTLVAGRCQLAATSWSEPRALARVAGAPTDAVWAESRAGAAPTMIEPADDGAGSGSGSTTANGDPAPPANDVKPLTKGPTTPGKPRRGKTPAAKPSPPLQSKTPAPQVQAQAPAPQVPTPQVPAQRPDGPRKK